MRGLAPAIVFGAALVLFSLNLDRPPHPDELHHVLAGQHLLESGRPSIGEGEYSRGILYTWLVSISYRVLGEGIASARLPAVILVALIVPILFVWVRKEAGTLAAWISAAIFVTSPFVVEIAQFSRFYCLQMLFFTVGVISIYYAASPGRPLPNRAVLASVAASLFALSTWIQDTTLIGLLGIFLWIGGVAAFWLIRREATRRPAWWFGGAIASVIVIVAVASLLSDDLASAWHRYRTPQLFASASANEFWYYHLRFVLFYPTLWPLTGVLALVAASRNSRITWMAVTIFGVSFLATSFAAQKAMRYFSYAQPLLAIIWGIGMTVAVPALWRFSEKARSGVASALALPRTLAPAVIRALCVAAIGFVIIVNPFWLRTASVVANVPMPGEMQPADWLVARDALAPWIRDSDIVITTEELGAIYFLGRSDVRFSPSKLGELPQAQRFEFGIDPRVGLPVISKPESVERLMACFRRGIVVGPAEHWGNPVLISARVQAVIRAHARPIEVPKKSHLYAWGWTRQEAEGWPDYCAGLERFSGLRAAQ